MLGETPVQNAEGIRAIQVYNRDNQKRMKDGQRYHQSREGGSIHTDNVNIPELWDYMALTCLQVYTRPRMEWCFLRIVGCMLRTCSLPPAPISPIEPPLLF